MIKRAYTLTSLLLITILSLSLMSAATFNVNFRLDEKSHTVAIKVIDYNTDAPIGTPIFTKTDPFGRSNITFSAATEVRLSFLVMKNSAIIQTLQEGPFSGGGTIDLDLRVESEPISEETVEFVETTEETTENITNTTEENTTTTIETQENTTNLIWKITGFFTKKFTGSSIDTPSENQEDTANESSTNSTLWYYIIGTILLVGIAIGYFSVNHYKKEKTNSKGEEIQIEQRSIGEFTKPNSISDAIDTSKKIDTNEKIASTEKKIAAAEQALNEAVKELGNIKKD